MRRAATFHLTGLSCPGQVCICKTQADVAHGVAELLGVAFTRPLSHGLCDSVQQAPQLRQLRRLQLQGCIAPHSAAHSKQAHWCPRPDRRLHRGHALTDLGCLAEQKPQAALQEAGIVTNSGTRGLIALSLVASHLARCCRLKLSASMGLDSLLDTSRTTADISGCSTGRTSWRGGQASLGCWRVMARTAPDKAGCRASPEGSCQINGWNNQQMRRCRQHSAGNKQSAQ